jgi:hypothetical protein
MVGQNGRLPVTVRHEAEGDGCAHQHYRQSEHFGPTAGTSVSTLGHTTCSLSPFEGGHKGPGDKTYVLPNFASMKRDFK